MTLLDAVLFLPLIGFLLLLLIPKNNPGLSRMAALIISLVIFVLSLGLAGGLVPNGYSFVHDSDWISSPPIRYHVGLDGLSLWLVILTTLLTPISVLASWNHIDHRVKEFFAFLILLEFGLIGVFVSLDLFLFYVFWEIGLVPMYFLIGIWGHDRRIYAAVKFFIYTFAGSVLMLAAIIFLYNRAGTFDYTQIVAQLQSGRLALSSQVEMLLFLAFFIAFAIKVPLFPLHTWLPDAHVEAPTAGSIMLASVMLKMGTYGLVRFCLPLFPNAAHKSAPWVIALAVIGIIYGALVALVQPNMKKLVAYSSVSHLGFVVLGVFSFTQQGLDGAVYQMLNHGISTGALFLLVGYLYERRHSLEISAYGGVASPAPNLAIVFLIATLASIGLPMLNNFVGEYLVLQGASFSSFTATVFAAVGVILSACYMLWLYQRTFYGKPSESLSHHMPDLSGREWAAILPLLLLMLWMGTYTQTFLPSISAQNARILDAQKSRGLPEARWRMPANLFPTGVEYFRILPEMILTIAGVLVMFMEAVFTNDDQRKIFGPFSIVALLAALVASISAAGDPGAAFSNMLIIDGFASFFRVLVIGIGVIAILSSTEYLRRENSPGGEYYALILFSIVGQCVMVTANELIMIFIGLEISSIASYVLAGYLRDDPRNNESALKYFLLGSFATAFLLYGVAWIYGLTGSTNLDHIRSALQTSTPPLALAGAAAALMFVGFGFKISAAPFQIWAPDVYQGAPAPVSGFLSVGPKAAAFAILLRVFMTAFGPIAARWEPIVWACALATMIVGNFAALQQSNIKRMLAYSSIAHAGYVLVAVTAHSSVGSAAAMFYLAAYAFTNLGAFAVVTYLSRQGERYVAIEDFAGLSQRQPAMAAMLTIFLLSLIGVPLTAGFFGKFYIFKAALDANLFWLTVLGLLNSAVAAYYYLRILVVMYFKDPGDSLDTLDAPGIGLKIAVYASALGTLILGIFPGWVLDIATRAALK